MGPLRSNKTSLLENMPLDTQPVGNTVTATVEAQEGNRMPNSFSLRLNKQLHAACLKTQKHLGSDTGTGYVE